MVEHDKRFIQRRDFLRLASGSALAVTTGGLASTLAGCGGGGGTSLLAGLGGGAGGGPGGGGPVATQAAAGTVNTTQIGGTNLQVVSAHQASSPTDSAGAFK